MIRIKEETKHNRQSEPNDQPNRTMSANTTTIVNEFVNTIDKEKEYTLKELKDMLTTAYNANKPTNTAKPAKERAEKPVKRTKAAKPDTQDKPKKAPSAYNNYIKATIASLKQDEANNGLTNIDLMRKAAQTWKTLTKQEQEQYKTV